MAARNGFAMINPETTPEDFLAVCRELYGRRARGDLESTLALFAENAAFRIIGSRALIPAAGSRVGKSEIREALKAFDVDFEIVDFNVEDFVAELPRMTYVSWHMTLRSRGSGAVAEIDGIDRVRWENYRIVDCTRFFDTALVAALAQTDGHNES
jgi:ketosteroid isomerase-like protein